MIHLFQDGRNAAMKPKDLDLAGGVATEGSPPDRCFLAELLSEKLEARRANFLVTGVVECEGSESSAFRGAGKAIALATSQCGCCNVQNRTSN